MKASTAIGPHLRRIAAGTVRPRGGRAWLAALCLATLAGAAAAADTSATAIADLPPAAQANVRSSLDRFIAAKVAPDRSANNLGWDCQAAASAVELGVPGAPDRLAAIADQMLADVVRSRTTDRPIGWAADGPSGKACVAATATAAAPRWSGCAGPATVYAFQTGLGLACLARAGRLLQRSAYLAAAKDVMAYWGQRRQPEAPCPACIVFAASDSAADAERYVRNQNLFMAFGAAELGNAAGDATLTQTARQALDADIAERKAGNRGFLMRPDPIWRSRAGEADRIENHAASMALLLAQSAGPLGPNAAQQALTVYRDWAGCDNQRCKTEGCRYWAGNAGLCQATATAAHCAFRKLDAAARTQCESYLQQVPTLSGYALWSVMLGGLR